MPHSGLQFYNKFLLSYAGFSFPITLTLWHMIFCSILSSTCIWTGLVKPLDIPREMYTSKVIPIAACYALALWTGNAAYTLCSVSFMQMVKAGETRSLF